MMADPTTFIATWFTPSSIFIFLNLVIGTIALASRFNPPPKNDQTQQQPQLNRPPSFIHRVRSFNLRHYYHNEPTYVPQLESESESETTQPQLVRKPSLLERVTSFNFNKHEPSHPQTHYSQPESESDSTQPQLVRKPSLLERVMSFNLNKHEPEQPQTHYSHPESESESTQPQLLRKPSLLQRVMSFNLNKQEPAQPKSENPSRDPKESKVEMKKSASEMKLDWEEEDEETVERRRPATAAARSETTTCKEDEAVDAKADDFINRFKKQLRLQRLDSFIRYRNSM